MNLASELAPLQHGAIVMSVDSADNTLVSGSMDKTVAVWDIRALGEAVEVDYVLNPC